MRSVSGFGAKATVLLILLFYSVTSLAAIWRDQTVSMKGQDAAVDAVYYRALQADHDALQQALAAAPLEYTSSQGAEISLPMPDGSMQRFEVENSPIMAHELAARYPEIQTYRVRGVDDPTATGRLDLTPKGFHAMLSSSADTVYIDPNESGVYHSYYREDYVAASKGVSEARCLVESGDDEFTAASPATETAYRTSGGIREYRLAVAATGEYTQFHGGTVSLALAAIITAINRVNQIYERDLAIELVLIPNNDSIIYTDPLTDPYTNNDGITMLRSESDKSGCCHRFGKLRYRSCLQHRWWRYSWSWRGPAVPI